MVNIWQDSLPWRLLAWGPQFPAGCWLRAALSSLAPSFPTRQLTTWGETLLARQLTPYIPASPEWHPLTFARLYWLETSHQASPHSSWEGYIRVTFKYQEVGILGGGYERHSIEIAELRVESVLSDSEIRRSQTLCSTDFPDKLTWLFLRKINLVFLIWSLVLSQMYYTFKSNLPSGKLKDPSSVGELTSFVNFT